MYLQYAINPASAKRKREEGRYAVDLGARTLNNNTTNDSTDNTIFQQAFSGTLMNDEEVHSSWLTSTHSWTRDSVQRETKRHYGVVSLEQQIQATQQQLLEIKRKFASAAQASASVHHTTPSHEFHEARSMCNPFESLQFPSRLSQSRWNQTCQYQCLNGLFTH